MYWKPRPSVLWLLLIGLGAAIAWGETPATVPTTMPTTAPVSINWDQAKKYVGQTAVVTGPVIGTHDFGGAAVLNVGKDFPDPGRFTVFIPAAARKGFPEDLDQGKTITVTGTIKLYRKVPEIEADAAHVVLDTTQPTTQP